MFFLGGLDCFDHSFWAHLFFGGSSDSRNRLFTIFVFIIQVDLFNKGRYCATLAAQVLLQLLEYLVEDDAFPPKEVHLFSEFLVDLQRFGIPHVCLLQATFNNPHLPRDPSTSLTIGDSRIRLFPLRIDNVSIYFFNRFVKRKNYLGFFAYAALDFVKFGHLDLHILRGDGLDACELVHLLFAKICLFLQLTILIL